MQQDSPPGTASPQMQEVKEWDHFYEDREPQESILTAWKEHLDAKHQHSWHERA